MIKKGFRLVQRIFIFHILVLPIGHRAPEHGHRQLFEHQWPALPDQAVVYQEGDVVGQIPGLSAQFYVMMRLFPAGVFLFDMVKRQAVGIRHGMLQQNVRVRVHIGVLPHRGILVIDRHLPLHQHGPLFHRVADGHLGDAAADNHGHHRAVVFRHQIRTGRGVRLFYGDGGIVLLHIYLQLRAVQLRGGPGDLGKCPADLLLQFLDVQLVYAHAYLHLVLFQEALEDILRNLVVPVQLDIPDEERGADPEGNRQKQPRYEHLPLQKLWQKKGQSISAQNGYPCLCLSGNGFQFPNPPDADAHCIVCAMSFNVPQKYVPVAAQIHKPLRRIAPYFDSQIATQKMNEFFHCRLPSFIPYTFDASADLHIFIGIIVNGQTFPGNADLAGLALQ